MRSALSTVCTSQFFSDLYPDILCLGVLDIVSCICNLDHLSSSFLWLFCHHADDLSAFRLCFPYYLDDTVLHIPVVVVLTLFSVYYSLCCEMVAMLTHSKSCHFLGCDGTLNYGTVSTIEFHS